MVQYPLFPSSVPSSTASYSLLNFPCLLACCLHSKWSVSIYGINEWRIAKENGREACLCLEPSPTQLNGPIISVIRIYSLESTGHSSKKRKLRKMKCEDSCLINGVCNWLHPKLLCDFLASQLPSLFLNFLICKMHGLFWLYQKTLSALKMLWFCNSVVLIRIRFMASLTCRRNW